MVRSPRTGPFPPDGSDPFRPPGVDTVVAERRFVPKLRRAVFVLMVVVVVALGGVWMVLNTIELPPAKPSEQTSFVCDLTVEIGECTFENSMAHLSATEERVNVDYDDLPLVLVQAVLSAEDKKFFDHGGIDPMGIGRAFYQSLRGTSQSRQGGSTITQQYVKLTYLTSERTMSRKLREAILSIKLEGQLDKRDILTRYLNEIYFGRGAYGVEAASRAYFGIGVQNLKLHQAAYLAGLIRSPETADAVKNPEEASRRRASVLTNMVEEGYITQAAADAANEVPWVWSRFDDEGNPQDMTILPRARSGVDLDNVRYADIGSQFWLAEVRKQLRERFGAGAETRGLRVYTTFDPTIQREALESLQRVLNRADGPVGSLVSIDEAGRVRAMIGGLDYTHSKVNLALGKRGGGSGRQPGSTFKPFALAAFIESGYSIESPFRAPPTTEFEGVYTAPGKLWQPHNFGDADLGVLSVEEATWKSSNTVYAGLVNLITPERLVEMAKRLGVTADLRADYSLVLGTGEVSVMDMAAAYSTFASGGIRHTPYMIRRVEDASGRVLYDAATAIKPTRVIDKEIAETVNWTLKGAVEQGTGTGARIAATAAGKTGTTTDSKDAWFIGYTCHLTTAVWMGYEQPRKMRDFKGREVSGGSFPADIWRDFMSKATKGDEPCDFPETDFGKRVVNQNLAPMMTTTTVPSTDDTVTSSSVVETTTTIADDSATTTAPPATTTTVAPTTTAAPATTAAPTTTTTSPPPAQAAAD